MAEIIYPLRRSVGRGLAHRCPACGEGRLFGRYLKVMGLGREDMLIMKCFAHRPKDLGHARALIKAGVDINMVEKQIEEHKKNEIPQAKEALDFLDDLREEFE